MSGFGACFSLRLCGFPTVHGNPTARCELCVQGIERTNSELKESIVNAISEKQFDCVLCLTNILSNMFESFIWLLAVGGCSYRGFAMPTSHGANSLEIGLRDDNGVSLEEYDEEKRPYSFAWKASRHYNGSPDREHIEERDENGITRGVFRFVDPRHEIQEVVYHSDDSGFHVDATNLPKDTPVVAAAKQRHFDLFEQIRREHERIAKELEAQHEFKETDDYN